MKAVELMLLIGEAKPEFVMEADEPVKVTRISRKKVLLIAAAIAAALLLTGCVAVTMLRLQDMKVGQREYTHSYDAQGKPMEPEQRTLDELSFYGYDGSPAQLAARELNEFYRTYDPDGKKIPANDLPDPAVPEQYANTYRCYTPEMVQKVDEIAEKYGLKLLGESMVAQTWQFAAAQAGLGIENLLVSGSHGEIRPNNGMLYPPRDFHLSYQLTLAESRLWPYGVFVDQRYSSSDYLAPSVSYVLDQADYSQWEYTTTTGQTVLLALDHTGRGLIVAPKEETVLTYAITGNRSGSEYPDADDVIGKDALEELADQFDYNIHPNIPDAAVLKQALMDADKAHEEALARARQCGDLGEYLQSNIMRFRDWYYVFYDFYGDGNDTILLSKGGNAFYWAITLRDGEAQEQPLSSSMILENGGLKTGDADPETGNCCYTFYAPTELGSPCRHGSHTWESGAQLVTLYQENGQWYQIMDINRSDKRDPITEAQAQEIMAQYPEKPLNWTPVMDFPMADGRNLKDTLETLNEDLSRDQLLEKYRELAREKDQYRYFALRDVNGDGQEELLLSTDLDTIDATYVYRYGQFYNLTYYSIPHYTLCQDNVMIFTHIHRERDGAEEEQMLFHRFVDDTKIACFAQISHHKATDVYEEYGTSAPMSQEEAKALVEKYPPIDPGLRPISELTS